jgi:SOS-response transcriptional repressor LexA
MLLNRKLTEWGDYILDNLDVREEMVGPVFHPLFKGIQERRKTNIQSAKDLCQTALEMSRKLRLSHHHDVYSIGMETRFVQGVLLVHQGVVELEDDRTAAMECFEESLKTFSNDHARQRSMALLGKGLVERFAMNIGEALNNYQLALVTVKHMVEVEDRGPLEHELSKLIKEATAHWVQPATAQPGGTARSTAAQPQTKTQTAPQRKPRPVRPLNVSFVPVVGSIRAGKPMPSGDDYVGFVQTSIVLINNEDYEVFGIVEDGTDIRLNPAKYLYFTTPVTGDSMKEAGIDDGDYVILRRPLNVPLSPKNGDIVAAIIPDQDREATLKRFKVKNDTISLVPENPDYEPTHFKKSDPLPEIAGVAIALLRKRPSGSNRS